ncbi:MAG: glycosyltransferase [Myxococcales bacterium]|nr:MAG: glycosyltransferase [Myxococcales bacterium]
MRIALVTTYPPMQCSLGLYTRHLLRALAARDERFSAVVIGEDGAAAGEEKGITVRPTYSRREDYREKILNAAVEARAEVVHFQYATDLFARDERLPSLLEMLGRRGIRSVVTLHTVYADSWLFRFGPGRTPGWFHRELGRAADRLVVHHRAGMADLLVSQGVPSEKIAVIPHGTELMALPDPVESRRLLDLPETGVLFTFFGFIHVQKNVHTVVEAFARIARQTPQARLLVVGKPWDDRIYNRLYVQAMKARVRLTGLSRQIIIRDGYLPAELVPRVFAASDVLLLPHWQRYGSASGVFHQAIGAQKPIIVAKGPKFEDGLKRLESMPLLTPEPLRISQWSKAMSALAADAGLRERAREILAEYAEQTTWARAAAAHAEVYEGLLTPAK